MNRTSTSRRVGGRAIQGLLTLAASHLALGCGDPEASPPSAALEVNISGTGCQVAADNTVLPEQNPLVGAQQLANIDLTTRDTVTCRVTATAANTFTFSGEFRALTEDRVQINFSITAGAATSTNGNDGTGTTSLAVTRSFDPMYSLQSPTGTPCTVAVRAITAGGVWGEYNCSQLTDPQTPGGTCTGAGAFVFNNCSN